METCPNCGAEIRSTARFCTTCGFRIPERTAGVAESGGSASSWGVAAVESTTTTEAPELVTWPPVRSESIVAAVVESDVVAVADEPPAATTPEPPALVVPAVPEAPGRLASIVDEETINDTTENKVNIALFHIERLQQLVPDITGWSEEQAASVNKAIASLEKSLEGREDDGDPYHGLRETVKTARTRNRDIDVMVALTDRAAEIQDLLAAHDGYSKAVRDSLFALKPAAVDYVAAVKAPARRAPRKRTTRTTTTPAPDSATE
ncbi:MAG: zinc ribbon domain-containing protein [Thermomicrobiales bacterium]|nr:zinc ribbon domain-containing protein [Thermomicrobiales bacterium]